MRGRGYTEGTWLYWGDMSILRGRGYIGGT